MTVPLAVTGKCNVDAKATTRGRRAGLNATKRELAAPSGFRFGLTALCGMQAHFFSGPDGRQEHGMHPTANPVAKPLGPVKLNQLVNDLVELFKAAQIACRPTWILPYCI